MQLNPSGWTGDLIEPVDLMINGLQGAVEVEGDIEIEPGIAEEGGVDDGVGEGARTVLSSEIRVDDCEDSVLVIDTLDLVGFVAYVNCQNGSILVASELEPLMAAVLGTVNWPEREGDVILIAPTDV